MDVKHHFGDIYTALWFLTPQSLIIIPICPGLSRDRVNFLLSDTYLPVGVKPQQHFFLQHFSKNDLFRSINIITLNTHFDDLIQINWIIQIESNLMCSHTGSSALRVNMIYLTVWSSEVHLITYNYRPCHCSSASTSITSTWLQLYTVLLLMTLNASCPTLPMKKQPQYCST